MTETENGAETAGSCGCGSLLDRAADAIAFERERADAAEALIADALGITGNFLGQYGHSEIPMFRVGQDLANSVRKALATGGRPALPSPPGPRGAGAAGRRRAAGPS